MKNVITIVALLCFSTTFAQPSDSEIKQNSLSKGALEVRFTTDKGTVHTTLTEKWYMRTMESKWKTSYQGIYRWERNEYRYNYVGGKWVYARTFQNSSWYDGVPNPSEQAVVSLVKANLNTYLSTAGELIGEPESIKLAKDPKWEWDDLKKVTVRTEAVLTRKVNQIGDAEKVKQVFAVKMFRDSDDKNAPFTRFFSTAEGESIVIEKLKYEVEEDESPFAKYQQQTTANESVESVYEKFQINDLVTVNWNYQGKDFYKGKVIKKDDYNENRYFVEFETIQSAWIEAKWMSKRK